MEHQELHGAPVITIGKMRSILGYFARTTPASATGWAPPAWRDLDDQGLEGLCEICNRSMRTVCLPLWERVALIIILGKPDWGERPIAILGALYRIIMAFFAGDARDWCDKKAQFWDRAVQGSSALQAALQRNLRCEATVLRGYNAILKLWDIEKFRIV